MRLILCMVLVAASALADKNDNRRNKLPFVADAVGNSLPPPSNVPATVGSPVNLITPDRYEFYTFDESGELIKRLMTLAEIQAIVAAGEETDGLPSFNNDNPPTIDFNVPPPPHTKIHSVVTNVQNVLKAQMEAHKNLPNIQPTLDTPDVSDSWSLILPSIFGNTGVDIVLDKTSGSVTPPETETIEEDEDEENLLSKEGDHQVPISSSTKPVEKHDTTEKISTKRDQMQTISTSKLTTPAAPVTSTTITKPTTRKPTTLAFISTTTTRGPTTETLTSTSPKPITSSPKPTTIVPKPTTTTTKPTTTTTKPTTTTPKPTSTTSKPTTTTAKVTTTLKSTILNTKLETIPSKLATSTSTSTTSKPITTVKAPTKLTNNQPISITKSPLPTTRITPSSSSLYTITSTKPITYQPSTVKPIRSTFKTTTLKAESTTTKHMENESKISEADDIKVQIHPLSNTVSSTESYINRFEKISTFIPVSTVKYISERTTHKPIETTKLSSVTNAIKATTQTTKVPLRATSKPIMSTFSSSYSVTMASMEKFNATTITTQSVSPSTTASPTQLPSINKLNIPNDLSENDKDTFPIFDVAQSISQIASDLNDNYQPIPTTNSLLDKIYDSNLNFESKENIDIDIPSSLGNETGVKTSTVVDENEENFVKVSTIDPHENKNVEKPEMVNSKNNTILDSLSVKESSDIKTNNIITNNIQTLPTTSKPANIEGTTIDLVLSESMGDLLSQVVHQAPTIMDSKKENVDNHSTVYKNVLTNIENTKGTETTSETSVKVKKNTSTTTVKPVTKVIENKLSNNIQTTLTNKNDFNVQTKIPTKENTKVTNKPYEIMTLKNNKTDVNKKPEIINIKNNVMSVSNKTDNVKNSEPVTKNDSNKSEIVMPSSISTQIKEEFETPDTVKKENKVENTSDAPNSYVSRTNTTLNKISQSKLNEINLKDNTNNINKNGRIPELAPKIDDFRKKIQKVNIDDEELLSLRNNSWKLVPTLSPPKVSEFAKDKVKSDDQYNHGTNENKDIVLEFSTENQGLEVTTKDLDEDLAKFSELFNELAFRYWSVIIDDFDKKRSFVFSPYSTFSMLAMIFMGARGATSGEMNEILKLDDMVTFNPHFTLKNVSDSIEATPYSGVAVSVFARELYSDRNKGKILTFYKERAQHFYNGHVEEINFKLISDIIRRRTNLLIKRYSWGKVPEFMKTNNIVMQPPLAAFTANIFQTDCSGTSVEGRDGEMYFVVSPNVRQRRLVPVPAVVYRKGFLAGYDPVLDVTVAALGSTNTVVSTLFLMPGQQGNIVHADDLEKLEQRLLESSPTTPTWNRVLRSLLPRTGLELQIPRFSHKSTFNASSALKKMGLKDLFDVEHADLGGLNGPSKDLYLSDMVQLSTFATCGEGVIGEQHQIEEYPETLTVAQRRRARWLNDWDEPRDYQRAFHDPHDISDAMHLPLHLRPRQARLPARSNQPARLKYDRPFLYFVRHNPSGMILYFGRYNPRLLP